jgi:hypothetical protein
VRLREVLENNPDVTRRLRALWALHDTKGTSPNILTDLLKDRDEYIRAWAIQLLAEDRNPGDRAIKQFETLAATDPSPIVRLYLSSALTRLPIAYRWGVFTNLVAHAEDAGDQNLPFMYWYALEPMVVANPRRALALAMNSKIAKLREFTVRRMVENVSWPPS